MIRKDKRAEAINLDVELEKTIAKKLQNAAHNQVAHQQEIEKESLQGVEAVLVILIYDYMKGGMTFEALCRKAYNALSMKWLPAYQEGNMTSGPRLISTLQCQRKLGQVVETALDATPKKRDRKSKRNRPQSFCKLCAEMVEFVAKEERLPKSRVNNNGQTAFERASQILTTLFGERISPISVEKACGDWRKANTP